MWLKYAPRKLILVWKIPFLIWQTESNVKTNDSLLPLNKSSQQVFVEFTSENSTRKIVLTIFQVILFGFPRENRKGVSCTHSDVWRFPIWFPRRKILCILYTGWLNKLTGGLWRSFSRYFPLFKGQFRCGHVIHPIWRSGTYNTSHSESWYIIKSFSEKQSNYLLCNFRILPSNLFEEKG